MTISIGQSLPDVKIQRATTDGGVEEVNTGKFFAGRKVVLFGVPGAFTPTCTNNHLPGFVNNYDEFKSSGIDEVAVIAVNDAFVMGAWAQSTGADGRIVFLADGSALFARAVGLDMDLSKGGLGIRNRRFSMLVDNRVVEKLNIEATPSDAEISGAACLLKQLG